MESDRELGERLEAIFMPFAVSRRQELLARHGRLVHYTTAENAIKIIQSKSLWMRNARVMNDFSEVEHGYNELKGFFQDESYRAKFLAALDKCAPKAGEEAVKRFDQWWSQIQITTYICCLSEHDAEEDRHGRLSMWRAFGHGTTGVAVVLKFPEPYSAIPLHVFLSPVAYLTQEKFRHEMDKVINNVEQNHAMLRNLPSEHIINAAYLMLMMAAVSLKHPVFHEEREWRLIHLPAQYPSLYVPAATVIVGGVPQVVRIIPLKNQPDAQINGIELPQLLDRVIIGPTQYGIPIYESLVKELSEVGVENPIGKIAFSNIPLRS